MNTKDWKAFKKYRTKLSLKWYTSKEYQDILDQEIEIFKPIKYKFLWWEWKEPRNSFSIMIGLERLRMVESYHKPFIPDETVEECLNWLARKK